MASRNASPLRHPEEAEIEFCNVLAALSHPWRLAVVCALDALPGRTCGSFAVDTVKSSVSRHFRVLREAGVIYQHDEGTLRRNTLRREELDRRFPGLLELAIRESPQRVASE